MSNVNMLSGSNGSKGSTKVAREQASADAGMLYKTAEQITGGLMFAYTVAALTIMGAFEGLSFRGAALNGMFGSDAAVNHHSKKGNLVAIKKGVYKLSDAGNRHFGGRPEGKTANQKVEQEDVDAIIVAIKKGPNAKGAKGNAAVARINWRKTGEIK